MQKLNSLKLFHKKALWKLFKKIQLLVPLDLSFSSKAIFLIFTPREALEPLKNVLCIWDSCEKTKTIIKTILLLHNWMTFPLQITVIRIGKDSHLNFLKNFKFTLLNSIIKKLDFGKFQRQNSLPGTWIPL